MPPAGAARSITGEEITEGVDLVIAAIGQHVQKFAGFGIATDAKGRIVADKATLATSRPGVYAGGDCVLGPSSLIESVAQGRIAASAIDRQLGGDGNIEETTAARRLADLAAPGRRQGLQPTAPASTP